MNEVGIVYESSLLQHRAVDDHVERPERIAAIYRALVDNNIVPQKTISIRGRVATDEEILGVHDQSYLQDLKNRLTRPIQRLADRDMYANEYTFNCAKLAAGSSIELVNHVLVGTCKSGLALVRPPGHHACSYNESGFCYLNNVMIASIFALNRFPALKIWMVDIDVHLGDGTIQLIRKLSNKYPRKYGSDNLRYLSIHRYDNGRFYPGNSLLGATTKSLTGQIVNVGFNGSKGDKFYHQVFETDVCNAGMQFKPDLIIVSAGFDAARGDPLGGCDVTPAGYQHMIATLQRVQPRIAMILEGGYNLTSISNSAVACVNQLLDQ